MKPLMILISLFSICPPLVFSQLEPYGLDSLTITDLRFYGNTLYASTDSHGVFNRLSPDSGWIPLGLKGRTIRSVYPHQVGPLGFAVTVGVEPDRPAGDSTLVYCWFNQTWNKTDTGMNHGDTGEIRSIDGIPTAAVCGETFAAGSGKVFRKKTDVWEKVFEGAVVNVVRISPHYEIWIGGETNIFWPFLAKSTDIGETWTMMYPYLDGDNACNSIAFDPTDSNIVYAGMEGVVIKTTDGGVTWERTGLTNTPFYLRGLAINPSNPEHIYAGGVASPDSFGLFESADGGTTWQVVPAPAGTKGISSIEIDPSENRNVYVATLGSGVFRYRSPIVGAQEQHLLSDRFFLFRNYPNPFNPVTTIRYDVPKTSFVTLKVYNVLGQEIATLVNEAKNAGRHETQFDGSKLTSGVYFYRLQAGDYTGTIKLLLIK